MRERLQPHRAGRQSLTIVPRWVRLAPSSAVLLAMLVTGGCSEGLPTLSGKVTVDGKAVPEGMVAFHPVGAGAIAFGDIQPDGSYEVKTGNQTGLKSGEYRVVVVAVKGIPPPATPENRNVKVDRWVPVRYSSPETTDLTFRVEPGANNYEVQCKSK